MLNKAFNAFLSVGVCLALVTGCTNFIESGSSGSDEKFGSLIVKTASSDSSASMRSLFIDDIAYAVVSVSGTGISMPLSSDFIACAKGTNSATVTISNIPVGKNRIVTVQGYSSEKELINGAVIRNICDISASNNSCTVTQGTTVYNWYDGTSATVNGGKVTTFAGGTASQPILVSDKNPETYGVTF